eukprot:g2354.t1
MSSPCTSSSTTAASASSTYVPWAGEEESKGGGKQEEEEGDQQSGIAEEFISSLEEPVAAGTVTTLLAGSGDKKSEDGVGTAASFDRPFSVAPSRDGKLLYVSEISKIRLFVAENCANKIRVVNVADGAVTTLAGSGEDNSEDGVGAGASFFYPAGLALSPDGKRLFVAENGGNKIRVVNVAGGAVTTLAGSGEAESEDGVGAAASFQNPVGLALSLDGKQLFVSEEDGHKIRVVNVADGAVTTLAGSGESKSEDGVGAAASFSNPAGLALSPNGKQLFVADFESHIIRAMNVADRAVTTLAGSGEEGSEDGVGAAASFNRPADLALSPDGKQLFVVETCGNKIRAIQLVATEPQPPIVIPPSTLLDDFKKMTGDPDLPQGLVTFIVGPERKRFEHVTKPVLCVRSEYFDRMFRNAMAEGGGGGAAAAGGAATPELEVEVPDTDPASFQTLLTYILTDRVTFSGGPRHVFSTLQLARKHGVVRLERLCLQALEAEQLTAESAVPLLEAARAVGSGCDGGLGGDHAGRNRLFDTCRRFIRDHGKDVKDAGGLEQLQELPVAVGLLSDSIEEVERLHTEVDRLRTKYEPGAGGGGGGSRKRRRQG